MFSANIVLNPARENPPKKNQQIFQEILQQHIFKRIHGINPIEQV